MADSPVPNPGPSLDVSSGSTFITIGVGATALLIPITAASSTHGANDPGTLSLTLNPSGQALTLLGPKVDQGGTQKGPNYLFGLLNPAPGAGVIHVAWTDTTNFQEFYIVGISFKGTVTSSLGACFYAFNTAHDAGTPTIFNGVSTSAAVNVGDMAVSMHVNPANGFNDPASNATGIEVDRDQAVTNDAYCQYFNGAGSIILAQADNNSSFGTTDFWSAAVVAIAAQ